ncbi:hypothetical protein V6N11_079659 [Hibiscus sabdariffa]|uniref:Uncharacterized protein n=1 Tax=Hibiscus sabdariffa TaxID=183260 RepID=A0ABR2RWA9_9ROSI
MEIIVVGAAANIFSEAEKGIFHDAKRHVRYVIFYQKTVDKFDEKLKTLAAKNMCGARCRCRKEEQGEDKSRYPGMEPQREWTSLARKQKKMPPLWVRLSKEYQFEHDWSDVIMEKGVEIGVTGKNRGLLEQCRGFDEEKFHDTFTKCHNVVDE